LRVVVVVKGSGYLSIPLGRRQGVALPALAFHHEPVSGFRVGGLGFVV